MEDLNQIVANSDDNYDDEACMSQINITPTKSKAEVTCFFRDIESHLGKVINEFPVVVGCTAWLTNPHILAALATKQTAIIVQKEDFLRPDAGWQTRNDLRDAYQKIGRLERLSFPGVLQRTSVAHADYEIGVRCMGHARQKGQQTPTPVMHHKFMVFGKLLQCTCKHTQTIPDTEEPYQPPLDVNALVDSLLNDNKPTPLFSFSDGPFPEIKWTLDPNCPLHNKRNPPEFISTWGRIQWEAVWTGSFNPTNNATRSLENAVLIRSPKLAQAYATEFEQIALMSEPLNWESEWVNPEWRIGT